MRIGILTFHRVPNYGAILQAYALKHELAELGHDVQVIDYTAGSSGSSSSRFLFGVFTLPRIIRKTIRKVFPNPRVKALHRFAEKRLSLSRAVNKETISSLIDEYDAFVVGSDQVWNLELTGHDATFFLDFVPSEKRKIAYAASFGLNTIQYDAQSNVATLINDFTHISVRELGAVNLCRSIGVDKPVSWVLDPTLLTERSTWENLASKESSDGRRFVLLYLLRESKGLIDAAKRYALLNSCEVICVSRQKLSEHAFTYMTHPSVERFVSLFRDAEYVLTNSYHGVCISLQFNKQFSFELYKGSGRHVRLLDLSDALGIGFRELGLQSIDNCSSLDYTDVITRIDDRRTASMAFLEASLG